MKRLLAVIAASLIIVSLTPAARAQEGPAGGATKAGIGTAGLKKNYETYDLGELYVKGERLPTSQEVTQMSVVTQEEIEATHSQNVAQALSHVPGIVITTGFKNQPSVSLQGLNQTETLVLIDGVPYYETNFGLLNLKTIPVEMIDKIVVEKGVSSVLWGPNAVAGVINIITRKPTERPSLDIKAEYGDYQASDLSLSRGMKKGILSEIEKSPYTEAYAMMPAEDLFETVNVRVELRPEDMPGKPLRIVTCENCGERVMDMREERKDGKVLCRPCASGRNYYSIMETSPGH